MYLCNSSHYNIINKARCDRHIETDISCLSVCVCLTICLLVELFAAAVCLTGKFVCNQQCWTQVQYLVVCTVMYELKSVYSVAAEYKLRLINTETQGQQEL
jgi:hypothetical protein